MPLFSIVVPLYNKKDTINRCINSILEQTVQDFEIIIIFRRYGEETEEEVTSLINYYNDKRIRMILQIGRGVSNARNEGIRYSRANLIAFIDADDEWHPVFLENILSLVNNYPRAGAYATAFRNIKNGNIIKLKNPLITRNFIGLIDYFESALDGPLFCTSSLVMRKESLLAVQGFDEKIWFGEDNDLWARFALKYDIAFSSSISVNYYLGIPGQATTQNRPIIHHFVDYVNLHKNDPLVVEYKVLKYTNYRLLIFVLINIANGHPIEARILLNRRPSNIYIGKIIYCYLLTLIHPKLVNYGRSVIKKIRKAD